MATKTPSSSGRVNIAAYTQKIDVDNRIPLQTYYNMAYNLLKQADIFRAEKKTIDLYIMLLRFSSLVTETIPYHRDYYATLKKDIIKYKRKPLSALAELEELKPAVQQKIVELKGRNAYQENEWGNQHQNNSQKQHSNCDGITKSAMKGRQLLSPRNHPIPQASKANGWENVSSESSHFGMNSSGGSAGISDQVWVDKQPLEAWKHGWGDSATECKDKYERCSSDKPTPPGVSSSRWTVEPANELCKGIIYEPAKNEFKGWMDVPVKDEFNGWGMLQSMPANNPTENTKIAHGGIQPLLPSDNGNPTLVPLAPSAPPLPEVVLDASFADLAISSEMHEASSTSDTREENNTSLCIICWEAPVEGACVPCGHMAGCMPCLNEIKFKQGDCPVCRAKIDQVIKIYVV